MQYFTRSICHCISDKNKGRTSCTTCDRELKEHVDYSAVLDTMLWSYFFASAELEKSDLYAGYCRQIVQLLPLLRCYLTRQELGSTFFRWQCYFATHVIYYFSDYGQQALNRQLFSEEFRLIVNNLEHVTKHLKVKLSLLVFYWYKEFGIFSTYSFHYCWPDLINSWLS